MKSMKIQYLDTDISKSIELRQLLARRSQVDDAIIVDSFH